MRSAGDVIVIQILPHANVRCVHQIKSIHATMFFFFFKYILLFCTHVSKNNDGLEDTIRNYNRINRLGNPDDSHGARVMRVCIRIVTFKRRRQFASVKAVRACQSACARRYVEDYTRDPVVVLWRCTTGS